MKTLEELRTFFQNDRFATELCAITIDALTETGAQCSMRISAQHLNGAGVIQGGAIFTLCDTCFAAAANAGDALTVSLGSQITYLRPGTGDCLSAVATLVSQTRSTCFYRVEVFDGQQNLIAYATTNGFRKSAAQSGLKS